MLQDVLAVTLRLKIALNSLEGTLTKAILYYSSPPREDEGVRKLLPHICPIPILIPLKLFLETNSGKFKFQITYLVLKQLP